MTTTELQKAFLTLRDQCEWLRTCYNNFNALYDGPDEEVLRASAETFFTDLNKLMVEYYVVLVARITDNATSAGKPNLTISYITACLDDEGLLTHEIIEICARIHDYRTTILDARNKIVSHLDRDALMNSGEFGAHSLEGSYL